MIEIVGLEAARFVERMELNNFAATGVFDGVIPIVFDEMGNGHLEGGNLASRAPGGNLSYVGQLTYEDLSYVGKLGLQRAARSAVQPRRNPVDGPLTGEIVTRVQLRRDRPGGNGAKANFITRQIANCRLNFA